MESARRVTSRSTNGCGTCKKRKVKCDEAKPSCANCLKFRIPCMARYSEPATAAEGSTNSSPARSLRHPGRPRKDWASILDASLAPEAVDGQNPQKPLLQNRGLSPLEPKCSPTTLGFNPVDLELLLHFATHTGPSLADPIDPNNTIPYFWAHNAPQIGLQGYPFLFHLMYSLACRHMVFLGLPLKSVKIYGDGIFEHLASLAEYHMSQGLVGLTELLPSLDASNSGALFVSSLLVCYCIFAVGPQGPDDLLVCSLSEDPSSSGPRMSLVRGAMVIQEIQLDSLLTGLAAPTGPGGDPRLYGPQGNRQPAYMELGFGRIEWTQAFDDLGRFVIISVSHDDDKATAILPVFKRLRGIFEATFGRDEEPTQDVEPLNKLPLAWLNELKDDFIDQVRQKDVAALLIMAHFVVLFRTMEVSWYLRGWTEHIILRVREHIATEYHRWLRWPAEAANMGYDFVH